MDASQTISAATDERIWKVFVDRQKIQRHKWGQMKCDGEEASEKERGKPWSQSGLGGWKGQSAV